MTLRVLSRDQVKLDALIALGLGDTTCELMSLEAFAAMIRRAAGFLCPCSAKTLVSAVTRPLYGLLEDYNEVHAAVEDILEEIIAIGDLQECRNVALNNAPMIYIAPPSYVQLGTDIILLGVVPDHISPLPEDSERQVEYDGCLRYLRKQASCVGLGSRVSIRDSEGEVEQYTLVLPLEANLTSSQISIEAPMGRSLLNRSVGDEIQIETPSGPRLVTITRVENHADGGTDEDLALYLNKLGFIELTQDYWLKAPPDETPAQHIDKYKHSLDMAPLCGDIPDLKVLDPCKPVCYYRGRWTSPKGMNGHFIVRRPQTYGNDLWCYAELITGKLIKFIDLPLSSNAEVRGCDEAWRLQAAIDAHRGEPQKYRLHKHTGGNCVVDIFSPPTKWVERRWSWTGKRIACIGSLMSFQFRIDEIEEELDFAKRKLWLSHLP